MLVHQWLIPAGGLDGRNSWAIESVAVTAALAIAVAFTTIVPTNPMPEDSPEDIVPEWWLRLTRRVKFTIGSTCSVYSVWGAILWVSPWLQPFYSGDGRTVQANAMILLVRHLLMLFTAYLLNRVLWRRGRFVWRLRVGGILMAIAIMVVAVYTPYVTIS